MQEFASYAPELDQVMSSAIRHTACRSYSGSQTSFSLPLKCSELGGMSQEWEPQHQPWHLQHSSSAATVEEEKGEIRKGTGTQPPQPRTELAKHGIFNGSLIDLGCLWKKERLPLCRQSCRRWLGVQPQPGINTLGNQSVQELCRSKSLGCPM